MDHEQKLQEYRVRNSGSLPTQVQANLQGIQTTQMQLQSLQDEANRDRDRRVFLERAIAEAEAAGPIVTAAPQAPNPDGSLPQPMSATARLEGAKIALRNMELRLKPEHPDIQRAKRAIRDLEKEAETEALTRPVADGQPLPSAMSPAERARQTRLSDMRAELGSIDRRLTARRDEEQRLRNNLNVYQSRVDAAPARETELVELMRDYDILKNSYNELLRKSEASKLAVNLERRQIGEQFKIVDGARLPERPVSPNRPRIIFLGAFMGLGFGLVIVALLEYRDSSLKTDDDVLAALALPVLALIPVMVTKAEEAASVRRRRLIAIGSVAVFVLVAGAAVWKLNLFEWWVG
jgi:uncharacterized protein involved in exopolysaccharide biosynthesis